MTRSKSILPSNIHSPSLLLQPSYRIMSFLNERSEISKAKTGSWASKKDYSLPVELLDELRRNETVQDLLDRYIPVIETAPIVKVESATIPTDASIPGAEQNSSAFMIMNALLKVPDALTANGAPAYEKSDDPLVE